MLWGFVAVATSVTKVAKRKVSHQLFITLAVAVEGSEVKKGHQKGLQIGRYPPDDAGFASGFWF